MRLRQKGGPIDRMEPSSRRAFTRVRPLWDLAPGHALSGRSSLRLPAGGRSIAGAVAGGPGSIARSASSRSRRGSSLTASRTFGIIFSDTKIRAATAVRKRALRHRDLDRNRPALRERQHQHHQAPQQRLTGDPQGNDVRADLPLPVFPTRRSRARLVPTG